jgi:hypothetical protein
LSRRNNRQFQSFRPAGVGYQIPVWRIQITANLFPCRVAVGWLSPHFDEYYLAGSHRPSPTKELLDQNRRLLRVGRLLRDRLAPVYTEGAIGELHADYAPYIARLLGDPVVQQKLKQGFQLKLIDLHKVCALQTVLSLNHVARIAAMLDPSDPLSTARVALPMTLSPRLVMPALSVNARSLEVTSISAPQPTQPISHIHVAKLNGKYLLTDGHHRGYAFLKAGVQFVPGFYIEATTYASLGLPPGLLPASMLNKSRPPMLTDFMIDGFAVDL